MSRTDGFPAQKPDDAGLKPSVAPRIRPNRRLRCITLQSGSRLQHIVNVSSRGIMIVTALVASLCACSVNKTSHSLDETKNLSPRVIRVGDPVPKGGGVFKLGDPYLAGGKWYTPVNDQAYDQVGIASWYGDFFHGRRTANGEIYDMNAMTAAHPTLPMPTYVTVTNMENGRSIVVRINDRGPYHDGRIIDLSHRAAELLGLYPKGSGMVRVRYVSPAPLDGDDTFERTTLARQPWAPHLVRDKQARAHAPKPSSPAAVAMKAGPAPGVVGDAQAQAASSPKPSFLSAATVTLEPPSVTAKPSLVTTAEPHVVTQKGGFEKAPKESSGGWVTNPNSN